MSLRKHRMIRKPWRYKEGSFYKICSLCGYQMKDDLVSYWDNSLFCPLPSTEASALMQEIRKIPGLNCSAWQHEVNVWTGRRNYRKQIHMFDARFETVKDVQERFAEKE